MFVDVFRESGLSSQRLVLLGPSDPPASVTAWMTADLPANIQCWVNDYNHVGQRGLFLWRWCLYAVELITLSTVEASLRKEVLEIKFLIGMYNCLVDDVADEGHNHALLHSLLKLHQGVIPEPASPDEIPVIQFTSKVWWAIWDRAQRLPRFEEFKQLLAFDLKQLGNTIEHADLVYQIPELMSPQEHELYSAHGMMVTISASVDLMASPAFDRRELGALREMLWHAESMARIGNMISTWEREIDANDFSSGVFMEAIWRRALKPSDLSAANRNHLVQTIIECQIEEQFVERWNRHRESIRALRDRLETIDLDDYVDRLDSLFDSELISHGRK